MAPVDAEATIDIGRESLRSRLNRALEEYSLYLKESVERAKRLNPSKEIHTTGAYLVLKKIFFVETSERGIDYVIPLVRATEEESGKTRECLYGVDPDGYLYGIVEGRSQQPITSEKLEKGYYNISKGGGENLSLRVWSEYVIITDEEGREREISFPLSKDLKDADFNSSIKFAGTFYNKISLSGLRFVPDQQKLRADFNTDPNKVNELERFINDWALSVSRLFVEGF